MPEQEKKAVRVFSEVKDLNEQQRKDFEFVKQRITKLQEARTEQYGYNMESIWSDADRDYIPHRLKGKGKKVLVTDEDKGWRGQMVNLGETNWQSDIAQPNPYVKIQIALATLIDQNPEGVFSATSKKFQATSELMRQLYKRSWETAKSKQQLKLFVFNLAKYGWACARTYPLRISRKVNNLVEFNQLEPDKSIYEEKEVVEFNDIFRENLDPWNVWIDDMALPNNQFSMRDWCWRKVYALDAFKEEFANWKLTPLVQPGGITSDRLTGSKGTTEEKTYRESDLVEVYFYENKLKDLFLVIANGVPVVLTPLPISDAHGLKKLSLWQTYWNLRSGNCPYGIGIYEAMRYDNNLIDKVRNMTIDQLVISIYKMFFYQGTQSLSETGDIKITPGVGKQVLDPKNINWLQVPGPGAEAWEGLDRFKKDMDEASGITEPLLGTITGKTAFEIAQAKEAALKRLKNPLENITDALNTEAYITVALSQLLYSVPEVYEIVDPALIDDYLKEIDSDPQLYERTVQTDENGVAKDIFKAKVFPEFPLNLDKDEKGNLIETQETQFFRVKPESLNWEGIINVKSQSVLTSSKQVEKALDLEMYNMLIPLIAPRPDPMTGQDIGPMVYGKVAKALVKLYDKDPRDILPDNWNQDPAEQQQQPQPQPPLFLPAEGVGGASGTPGGVPAEVPDMAAPEAETMVSSTGMPERPQGIAQRIVSRLSQGFR